jgi:K+-transporting ATPase ATPase C chain
MRAILRPALVLLALLTALTGAVYPLVVTGVTALVFPRRSQGSPLVDADGVVIGSALIGQTFTDPRDFWGRPSAVNYDASTSGATNMGPLHPELRAAVTRRIAALRALDPEATLPVPADLVLASASGLDPHISPAAARYQARRVARARGLAEAQVQALFDAHTEGPTLGFLDAPRVHVLRLNRALDELSAAP